MDISVQEYEKKRTTFELCEWLNDKLAEMERDSDFEEIYFRQDGKPVKRLVEEVRPIAALGLYLFRPGSNVGVQCLMGNQHYDAEIEITGFMKAKFKVEVITDENEKSVLRRLKLAEDGFAYGTFTIEEHEGKKIQMPQMVEAQEQEREWIDLALSRLKKKVAKGYDKNTAILVRLDLYRPLSLDGRAQLIRETRLYLDQDNPEIYAVYYCDVNRFIVDEVKPRR